MTAFRIKNWTREDHPIRGDIVRFKSMIGRRIFNIHEDLLCTSSEYFRKTFQGNRKPIEGDCSICYHKLKSKAEDVTFCRYGCGQNLHKSCLDTWTSTKTSPKCPMCRKDWIETSTEAHLLFAEIQDSTIQLYVNWLYRGFFPETEDATPIHQNNEAWLQYHQLLVKAWELSSKLQAKDFADLVVGRIIESMDSEHGANLEDVCIESAYGVNGTSEMRRLAVNLFLVDTDAHYIVGTAARHPKEFFVDLSVELLGRAGRPATFADVTERYFEGEFEDSEDSEDNGDDDDDDEMDD
ncbi:hypothetical protein IQ07DRAFT_676781 [Pyrenochaeta sp. DS3sAY3a]|nr:hypothetical protein IQ07DRAFT_676781 [Pyrenochaeta sp. DS3sAY3a]